jgi:hypothetical protein
MEKKHYQSLIWKYEKRRQAVRDKYKRGTPEYRKGTKQLTIKISRWKQQIRRIDARTDIASKIYLRINEFFETDIRIYNGSPTHALAIKCFYKYGIEFGLSGRFLGKFLNRKSLNMGSELRLRLTRSFKTNPDNRNIYHKLKSYINEAA